MKPLKLSALLSLLLVALFTFSACQDDDTDFDDNRVTELKLDKPNASGPILAAGQHRFAVRFTESDLRAVNGKELVGFRVFVGRAPASLELIAYDEGEVVPFNEIGALRAASPIASGGFFDYEFARPLVINADKPLWLVAEVTLDQQQQSIGCDAGPAVFGGDWLWSEDSWQTYRERTRESVNWNIRGLVR